MNRLGSGWTGLVCVLVVVGAVRVAGQGPAPDTQHSRRDRGGLSLQSTDLNFGTVTIGKSKGLTAALVNASGSSIVVTGAVATDPDFKIDSPSLPVTLPAGQTVPVSVTFSPTAGGGHAGHLIISGDSTEQTAVANLSGTAVTSVQLSVNPSSINFGTVPVGSSQTQPMTLTNSGSSSLVVSQATVSGTGFQLSGLSLPLTLSAGQSVAGSVGFSPQSSGSASGTISINIGSSASETSGQAGWRRHRGYSGTTMSVPLSGTGTTTGSLTAAPSSIGFGNVSMGTSQSSSATLTNSGGSTVTISQVTATGNGFSLKGPALPMNLSPGQSTSLTVSFTPQATGLATGGIAIASNGSNSSLNLPLSGTGVSAGTIVASPASLNFGTVQAGSSSSLSGTLTNSGGSSVTISQATVTGSAFAMSGLSLPLTLTAGQSTSFSVSFAPQGSGTLTGNLAIASNASDPTLNIGLSGTAPSAGALRAAPTSLGFGSVQTGSSKTLAVSVTNSGGSPVNISQVAASSASYSTSGMTPPVTLSAGQSFSFNVTFAPTAGGSANGTLSVTSNAPTLSVPLTGTGTTPGVLAVNPSSINFGNVVVGTAQSQTATLSASGAPVTVSSAGVSGSEFSVSGMSFPLTIAAGGTASFTVTFTPQASGTASANINFASNATNTSIVESVSGSGTAAPQHSVALSWTASTTSTVTGYNVYRGSVSGGPYVRVNSSPDAATTYTDSTVQAGQTLYYVVTAVDGSGDESAHSNQVQVVVPSP